MYKVVLNGNTQVKYMHFQCVLTYNPCVKVLDSIIAHHFSISPLINCQCICVLFNVF